MERKSALDLEFRFVGFHPPSTNDMYIPTASRKRGRGAFFRKSDWLKNWQSFVQSAFDSEFFYSREEIRDAADSVNTWGLSANIYIEVSIPAEEYWDSDGELKSHDSSNFIKAIEDAVCKGIGFDDKSNIHIHSCKGYNEDGEWFVRVRFEENELDQRIDIDTRRAYFYGS